MCIIHLCVLQIQIRPSQSLLPINESFGRYKRLAGKTNLIPEINKQLEALAKEKGLTYINLFPLFTEKGSNVLRADLTTDGLHPVSYTHLRKS